MPDNVVARGPGLQPGNTAGNPTHFDVITTGKPSLIFIVNYRQSFLTVAKILQFS